MFTISFVSILCCRLYATDNWVVTSSGNGLSYIRRQANIWTNENVLLPRACETNFSKIASEIYTFFLMVIHLKMSYTEFYFSEGSNTFLPRSLKGIEYCRHSRKWVFEWWTGQAKPPVGALTSAMLSDHFPVFQWHLMLVPYILSASYEDSAL